MPANARTWSDYGGDRQVTVYVPPDPSRAVVFAGDGQGVPRWGGALEAAGVPSTMIVGVHGLADETSRLQEYSPVFDAERFAAHERFFVGDVGRWARSRFGIALPAGRTAVFGVSAESSRSPSGSGIRMSTARFSPARRARATSRLACCRTGSRAPTSSPARWSRSSSATRPRWAAALRDAGADVVMSKRVASHGDALWRAEFPLMVTWAFGR
jgi:hypothetical protein